MGFGKKITDKYNQAVARTKKIGIGTAVGVGVAATGVVVFGGFAAVLFAPISIPLIVAGGIIGGIGGYKID